MVAEIDYIYFMRYFQQVSVKAPHETININTSFNLVNVNSQKVNKYIRYNRGRLYKVR